MHEDNLVAGKHQHFSEGLVTLGDQFEEGAFVDIEFIFKGCLTRRVEMGLLFMPPSEDPAAAETMCQMLGNELVSRICIYVVSFYDRAIEDHPNVDGSIFGKPTGSFDLELDELNYLYWTIAEMILRVADVEKIEQLYFGADTKRLKCIYDRYIKRYSKKMGFVYRNQGAYYAIRTQHYPQE